MLHFYSMAYNLKTVCILIADDNVLMLELLKNMLLLFGVGEVVTSKNGTEAYEKYVVYKPDLVITDWIMEDLDGLELAKKINCTPLFINRYYLENQNYNANYSFYSLNGAVKYILNK